MKKLQTRTSLVFVIISTLACNALSQPTISTEIPTEAPAPTEEPIATESPKTTGDAHSGSSGLDDSLYPEFGNGGYDTQAYILDITVNDVRTSDLKAKTTIKAIATQDLDRFNLDFAGFKITRITVNDEPAEFERNELELTIIPSVTLKNGSEFTTTVEYQGIPDPMESQALPFQTGWVVYDGGIFVLSEPDGSASFYPVNDHPLDKANYTILVTVPKPYEVAANGILKETKDTGTATTYRFEVRDPMASYLTTININDFDMETMESRSGVPIRNYYAASLPGDRNKPFARQGEMIDYFSGLFGEYPFEVYGSLVVDAELGTALESQTLSIFGMDTVGTEDLEDSEAFIAHELVHQWFGDSVSVADWGDIWLNEGFATYGEGLWVEHLYGREDLNEWVISLYEEVSGYPEFYPPPGDPAADDLFNGGVYLRGGLTLHALRLEIGDEIFFESLRVYYDRYKFGNASTEDFIQTVEEVSGEDLVTFFETWLYDEQLPPIPGLGLE